jgi:hypothetical protein
VHRGGDLVNDKYGFAHPYEGNEARMFVFTALETHVAEMCPFCNWLTDVGYGDRPIVATDVADLLL